MTDTPPPSSPGPAPGWYPDGSGSQRYWDGTQWTSHIAPAGPAASGSDDHTMAMLAHLLAIFTGFVGPLIIFLIKKDESPYVRHHAAESLNFQITVLIGFIVSAILVLILIGLLLMIAVMIGALVFEILAAVAANRGEWYRYPINIRFVS